MSNSVSLDSRGRESRILGAIESGASSMPSRGFRVALGVNAYSRSHFQLHPEHFFTPGRKDAQRGAQKAKS